MKYERNSSFYHLFAFLSLFQSVSDAARPPDASHACSGDKGALGSPSYKRHSEPCVGPMTRRRRFRYICDVCGKGCRDIVIHKRRHMGVRPFPCSRCEITFHTPSEQRDHLQTVHDNKKPLLCHICNSSFSYRVSFHRHLRTQHGLSPSGLKRSSQAYQCDLCGRRFVEKKNLRDHKWFLHSVVENGVTLHTCQTCGKQFTNKSRFEIHVKSHLLMRYSCKLCSFNARYLNSLNAHMEKAHKGEPLK